jgi:hypothetical protein
MQAATKANVWLYRRTSGRVGGRGMDKWPLLLLTVPGRRSGDTAHGAGCRLRAHGQISRCREGHGWLQEKPQWFRNLRSAGRARIRIRSGSTRSIPMSRMTPSERRCGSRLPPRHIVSLGSRLELAAGSRSGRPGSPTNPQEHRTGEHKQLSHYAERIGVQPAISHNPMSVEIMAEGRVPYQEPDAFGGTPQERSEAISRCLSYTGVFELLAHRDTVIHH